MKVRLHSLHTMFRNSGFIFRFRPDGFARYSTLSGNPHSVVDYLTHSLHFSKQDAIFLSKKGNLTHLKSTINSNLVVTILKNYGLNNTQIKQIISYAPRILTSNPTKTVEPKVRVFKELGLRGSDLVSLIKKDPKILWRGLHSRIIPSIDSVKKLVGSDENVIKVVNNSRWFSFQHQKMKKLSTNISLMQNYGLSNERIIKFMSNYPDRLLVNPNLFKRSLSYVEDKLGISRDLGSFIHAVRAVLFRTDSQIKKKMQIFSSFGWSDYEIATLLRAQPNCLNLTESYLSDKLKYFMKELNYTPSILIGNAHFWTYSLEKRIKPRNQVFNILKEKELLKDKPSLATIIKISEPKFLCFLKRFENHVPRLCDTYMNSIPSLKGE
ncbi:transcription termination factor MTERF8, chloroplastic-like [Rutidosis leptorrhynchoides]|uniref:transcription termination factor MTERF8, chloroplastic-like n=1 Tax=Rutidosis leptorrhynchoides TaxID=125765 RepID=UPI003A9A2330